MSHIESNPSPLRVGLIGLGQHGLLAVAPALLDRAKRARLVAVADVNPERLAQVDSPGVAKFDDYRAMLRREDVDAVFIATLMDSHAEIAEAALAAGKHVICEKPMAAGLDECQRMVRAAERADRLLIIDFEMRVYPHIRQMRRWIRDGLLGEVQAVHLQRMWDGHKSFGPLAARRARLIGHAGALDCGIHDLDLVRYLAGGRWSTLHAEGAWFGEGFELPPHISIVGRLDSGAVATVNASLTYTAHIEPRACVDFTVIAGTRGAIQVAVAATSVEEFQRGGTISLLSKDLVTQIPLEHPPHTAAIGILADEVAAVVAGETTVEAAGLATGLDGLIAQEAVEEAHRRALQSVPEKAGVPASGQAFASPAVIRR